jgi:hypothetical protein
MDSTDADLKRREKRCINVTRIHRKEACTRSSARRQERARTNRSGAGALRCCILSDQRRAVHVHNSSTKTAKVFTHRRLE